MTLPTSLTAVTSRSSVLLDSAEEDGGLLRFVCLLTYIYDNGMRSQHRGRDVGLVLMYEYSLA